MSRRFIVLAVFATVLVTAQSAFAGGSVVIDGTTGYVCNTAVDLDLVRVVLRDDGNDNNFPTPGLDIASGCSGTIERIEIEIYSQDDGIRVRNPASQFPQPHLTVNGGYVTLRDPNLNNHSDAVSALGGEDVEFNDLRIYGIDPNFTMAFDVDKSGAGSGPDNVVCNRCVIGPGANSTTVHIGASVSSGITNSFVCPDDTPGSGEQPKAVQIDADAVSSLSGTDHGNLENLLSSDKRCVATHVRNASFEAGSTFATCWESGVAGILTDSWTYPTTDANFGVDALRVDITSWTSGGVFVWNNASHCEANVSGDTPEIPVTGGTSYTATAFIKGTVPEFRWRVEWYVPGTGWSNEYESTSTTPTSTFDDVSATFTSPTGATLLKLQPRFKQGTGYGIIDDVEVDWYEE